MTTPEPVLPEPGAPPSSSEPTEMALLLTLLFASGSVLGSLLLFAGDYTAAERRGLGAVLAAALAIAIAMWVGRRRMSAHACRPLLAAGTTLITLGIVATDGRPDAINLYYVWPALYASYFFSRVQVVSQVALIAVAYAAALLMVGGGDATLAEWVVTVGTLVVAATLFHKLRLLTDRRLAQKERYERELQHALSLQQATLESTADGILVVDRAGRMVSFNRRFQEMWQIPDEIAGSGDDERAIAFVRDQLREPQLFARKVRQLYSRPEAESVDMLEFEDGRVFERHSRPQRGVDGRIHGRVWSFRDVSDRERIQTRLQHLADHDPLTGLYNRRRFEQEIRRRVAHAARYGAEGAILLLDVDDFKEVNDSLGHRTGDAVIRTITDLIRDRLRETDVLARLGGDELAVLLPEGDAESAASLAEDLLAAIREQRAMFSGKRLRLTASVGVAAITGPHVQTPEELMVEADIAMYAAKEAGRDRVRLFAPDEPRRLLHGASLTWSDRMRAALDSDGFELHAQPIVDLRTGRVSQHELLLRMRDDCGGLIPPRAFLASAERSGLIIEIDAWVARRAIRLIDEHRRAGRELRVEVNLSGRTLGDPELPALIERELAEHPIDPGCLIFEVTETAAVLNMADAKGCASALTGLGCRFALDDFGAGFSSFYYLKYMPVHFLKIDGDFVVNLGRNATDQAIVRTIVDLARSLGKETIAEFAEDECSLDLLREYGVDFAQGYHVGHPVALGSGWPDGARSPITLAAESS